MPFFGCCKSSDVAPRGDPSPSEALRVESLRPPATSPARVRAAPLTPLGPKRAAGTVQPPARAVSRPATRMRRLKREPTADALARTIARGVRADEAWNDNDSSSRPAMASPKRPSQESDESATLTTLPPPPAPDVTAAPASPRRVSSPLVAYVPPPKPTSSLRAFAALFDDAGSRGASPAPNPLVAPPRSSLSAASAAVAGSKSSGAASHRPSRSFEPPSEGPLARAASQHAAPRDASPEQSFHLDESDEEDDAAAASFVL
uniref:Uncharacterized protein n=1 Tax=Neobodo designis TaxID=312471 RepID=A0A7S1VZS6_NEODS|mmetsp:Transcript_47384/g.146192  ORF Transcript_47384/g.146192 Transcript_47384/m.146192 type:complete len:261 (+) Transcript_47384:70-852(+)